MADHPSHGRVLSDEEKAKYRDWQTNEILRRRGSALPPDAAVAPTGAPACPKCSTPYRNPKFKRCFRCERAVAGTPEPKPKPQPTPDPPPAPRPAPAEPALTGCELVPIPVPPALAPVLPIQTTVSALRGVVEILRSLDDDSARWVLESAYQLSRSQP